MQLAVDPRSALPPFEQVRAQIAAQIADRTLVTGTRLPTVRKLAGELGIAANTVARAYRELEAAGLVETRGRNGTVVSAAGDVARIRLHDAATQYAQVAHRLGIPPEEALAVVQAAVDSE